MIKTVLWDFGNTLVDETWMQMPMPGCNEWPSAYRNLVYQGSLGNEWSLGKIDAEDVAQALAEHLDLPVKKVLSHMKLASRNIKFFESVLYYAKSSPLPQSIVTVNPDLFSSITVAHYDLTNDFPVIVTSWEERTLSKAKICDVALHRQGLEIERSEALLIDNKQDNIDEWRDAGGVGYLFLGEHQFRGSPPEFE